MTFNWQQPISCALLSNRAHVSARRFDMHTTPALYPASSLLVDAPHVQTTYISTYLGNRFWPAEPRIDRIDIEDIAHGLAYQCRFNGQTSAFYSVAQHSIMVASILPPHLHKAALLHDAAEAYLGDIVKPLKHLLPGFAEIEAGVTRLIAQAFEVDFDTDYVAIKHADMVALATEKRDLMPNSAEAWSYLTGIAPLPALIDPLPPAQAKAAFLAAWTQLG